MRRWAALILSGLLASLVALSAPVGTSAASFTVPRASVTPSKGFTADADGVRIEFRIAAPAPADVTVRVLGGGREVRRFQVAGVQPGTDQVLIWDGLNAARLPVRDGSYRVLIGDGTGSDKDAGSVALRGHFFPVRGPHGTRGAVGDYGAARNGGRVHIGFDVTADCGTPLAAVRTGTVVKRAFDPRLDGNFVVIRGLGENRKYWYSHMVRPSPFRQGERVHIGDIVGHIGRTGNAGGTPCHLHLELYRKGRTIDPEPHLRAWDRYS